MPARSTKRSKPNPEALPSPSTSEPYPAKTRTVHGRAIPGLVYRSALSPMLGPALDKLPDPSAFAQSVIEDMAPRDPAEEMLVAQLLLAHARVMRLTELANRQTQPDAMRITHEYADRASNTYRRLMLALAEYRQPPRTPRSGDGFTLVKQANFAQQQVVQNHENSNAKATNEQGCNPNPGDARGTAERPPALPTDASRFGIPSSVRTPREAVEAVHRPTNAQR